jgi:hypothetical protein
MSDLRVLNVLIPAESVFADSAVILEKGLQGKRRSRQGPGQ